MVRISLLSMLFVLFCFLLNSCQLAYAKGEENVREACGVTRYPNLCIQTLTPFSGIAGRSPSKWARAGVSVTIGEVKSVQAYLARLKREGSARGGKYYSAALSDCVEVFGDALDELHRSLGVLRKLSRSTFGTQMGDLNTWISAALTDEDTCLDGFQGNKKKEGRKIKLLQNRIIRASYVTSNALALVNKLATSGLESASDP